MKQYYTDGVTKISDSFYVCVCPKGHRYWSCIYVRKCALCKAKLNRCVPANKKEETV